MRYYVIADLHGRSDLLEKAGIAIGEDIASTLSPVDDYKIITLGDYIDRGSASKQVIDYLISGSQYPDMICLQGNHEDMAVQTITKPLEMSWWLGNGGNTTLESYGSRWPYSLAFVPEEHVKWMATLPLYLETEKHVFVHAGVDKRFPLEDQDHDTLMWKLYSKDDAGGWFGKHVVHGHHQFASGPHVWEGRTDLDTFAWKTGRLVVGVFDDSQHKAIKFLEVLGDDYDHQRAGVE